ncbi:MAG: hypothetical protein ACP5NW_03810, partial [Candidatus Woesearchaeota archaeon]
MKKLSSITRIENCFVTVDNHSIKNIRDLYDYLESCDEAGFKYHVNEHKNDFAEWVENVLLFPELATNLRGIYTLEGTRGAISVFLRTFDFESKEVSEDKIFRTVDDYGLKNIQELYYYLNNCDDDSFRFHCNEHKNDFANWVSDVLSFPELAARMRTTYVKAEIISILRDFFVKDRLNNTNQEYKKYLDERKIKSIEVTKPDVGNKSIDNKTGEIGASERTGTIEGSNALDDPSLKEDEKINLKMNLNLKSDQEDDETKDSAYGMEGFKQFSDEDLEKFTSFVKNEELIETDAKVEYLRAALQELKNIIRDLRRAEKDPLIADLMLRTISAKIDYYAVSKNPDEYAHIIKQMKEAQHEMEECSVQQSYNIAEEILKDLKLQGIAMR